MTGWVGDLNRTAVDLIRVSFLTSIQMTHWLLTIHGLVTRKHQIELFTGVVVSLINYTMTTTKKTINFPLGPSRPATITFILGAQCNTQRERWTPEIKSQRMAGLTRNNLTVSKRALASGIHGGKGIRAVRYFSREPISGPAPQKWRVTFSPKPPYFHTSPDGIDTLIPTAVINDLCGPNLSFRWT